MTQIAQLTILDEVEKRFGNIKLINGYSADIGSIKRASQKDFKAYDLPGCNYWTQNDSIIETTYGQENHELVLTTKIHDLTRDKDFVNLATELYSDMHIALFRSTLLPKITDEISIGLGGLVDKLSVTSFTPLIGEGQEPWVVALMDINILYKTPIGDPFTIIQN